MGIGLDIATQARSGAKVILVLFLQKKNFYLTISDREAMRRQDIARVGARNG
jgi:hypothetical protein